MRARAQHVAAAVLLSPSSSSSLNATVSVGERDGGLRRDLRGGGGERAAPGGALRRDGAGPDRDPRGWQHDGVSLSRVVRLRGPLLSGRACGKGGVEGEGELAFPQGGEANKAHLISAEFQRSAFLSPVLSTPPPRRRRFLFFLPPSTKECIFSRPRISYNEIVAHLGVEQIFSFHFVRRIFQWRAPSEYAPRHVEECY